MKNKPGQMMKPGLLTARRLTPNFKKRKLRRRPSGYKKWMHNQQHQLVSKCSQVQGLACNKSLLKNKAFLYQEALLASAAAFTSCPAALNAPCAASTD